MAESTTQERNNVTAQQRNNATRSSDFFEVDVGAEFLEVVAVVVVARRRPCDALVFRSTPPRRPRDTQIFSSGLARYRSHISCFRIHISRRSDCTLLLLRSKQ